MNNCRSGATPVRAAGGRTPGGHRSAHRPRPCVPPPKLLPLLPRAERLRARNATPAAMQELADRYDEAKEKLAAVTKRLAHGQAFSATLRRIVAELDLELAHAREQLERPGTSHPPSRRPSASG
ncbi:hypothetical protein DJ64_16625 [Streptomyces griseorubens]|uniref:Uncharacterized protein n=2 Tax=Actinomycetota TaxID=201174 RepID=A0ABR4SX41_9ACTN|nr:hypothetical protein DJ64_16625 [Streptomyces griseorubens]